MSTDPKERPAILMCVNGALVEPLPASGPDSGFSSGHYPDLRRSFPNRPAFAHVLFTASVLQYTAKPLARDWSGFEKFRADVFSKRDAVIWIYLEDDKISPPASARFQVKSGTWATLEMDLNEAREKRGLNPAKMTNFQISGHAKDSGFAFLDNFRVSRITMTSKYPVLKSPIAPAPDRAVTGPSAPIRPFSRPAHAKLKTAPAPLRVLVKGQDFMSLAPCGWINAYDDNRTFLAFLGKNSWLMAVQTLDNGKTWTGLSKDTGATRISTWNPDHGSSRGQAVGLDGINFIVSSSGCGGWGALTPRQRVYRIIPDGESGWKADSIARPLESDIRHCGNTGSFAILPGGRIWAAWGHLGRMMAMGIHARCSDDQGLTWQGFEPGLAPAIPGSFDSVFTVNTYRYKASVLFAHGKNPGIAWREAKGLRVAILDGAGWKALPPPAVELPADDPESAIRLNLSAVSTDGNIFLASSHLKGVLHWDGKTWRHELADARDNGILTVSGSTVILVTPGLALPGPDKKQWVASEILYYEKPSGKAWSQAKSLTGDFVDLWVYRGMYAVSVPQVSPPNFVPVAITCRPGEGILIYRIPIR